MSGRRKATDKVRGERVTMSPPSSQSVPSALPQPNWNWAFLTTAEPARWQELAPLPLRVLSPQLTPRRGLL